MVHSKEDAGLKILAVATQGDISQDADRLRGLLSHLPHKVFTCSKERKLQSFVRLTKEIFRYRPELVVMEGTGIFGGAAVWIGRIFGKTRYIVSSGDAVGPYMRKFHPVLGIAFSIYERLLYRFCAGFIGWTPYLVGRALTFGAPKGMTAAGWAAFRRSPEEQKTARQRVRKELGISEDSIVVGIVGSLSWNKRVGYCYGYELVKAALATDRQDIHVLVVGDGDGKPVLERLAGDERNGKIHLTGRVSRQLVPDYLAAMDAASLPQSVDGVGTFRYTTKISEYFAAGLPIVTGQLPVAYDFPLEGFWRIQGKRPWADKYTGALADWLKKLSRVELNQKSKQVPRFYETFDVTRQSLSVTQFINDILSDDGPQPFLGRLATGIGEQERVREVLRKQ